MAKQRLIPILLVLILAALTINIFMSPLVSRQLASQLLPEAQAQIISEKPIYFLTDDSFIITANPDGSAIYLYYFERKPLKRESRLYFVTSAQANEQYKMP